MAGEPVIERRRDSTKLLHGAMGELAEVRIDLENLRVGQEHIAEDIKELKKAGKDYASDRDVQELKAAARDAAAAALTLRNSVIGGVILLLAGELLTRHT